MIGLTGATGLVGGLVRDRLDAAGIRTRLIVRSPARLVRQHPDAATAGYGDALALAPALAGVDTLFMVSAAESADRVAQHRTLIDTAVSAGVQRIVYLSFLGADPQAGFTLARDHAATEAHLRASGVTVQRVA
jgi:NAD(P)H dehydrogenase (quinone)